MVEERNILIHNAVDTNSLDNVIFNTGADRADRPDTH